MESGGDCRGSLGDLRVAPGTLPLPRAGCAPAQAHASQPWEASASHQVLWEGTQRVTGSALPPGTTTALSPTATPRRPSPPSRAATSCGARTSSPSTCASGGAASSVGGTTRTWVSRGARDVAGAWAAPGALRQESAELLPCSSAQCEAAGLPSVSVPPLGPPACRQAQPRAPSVGRQAQVRHCHAVG